jgi:hypothetical protein
VDRPRVSSDPIPLTELNIEIARGQGLGVEISITRRTFKKAIGKSTILVGEQIANMISWPVMARRPDAGKREEILSREHLDELGYNLSHMSRSAVLDFYQRAYRDCRIINSHTFPPARAVQELVQAWKQLRKWRR